jgi:hypothetical protein
MFSFQQTRGIGFGLDNQALVVTNERERFFAGATATAPWLPSSASGTLVTSRISGRRNVPDAPRRPHRGAADLAAGRGTEVEGGVPRQEEHQGRPRRARQRREARCQQCLGRRSRRAGKYHPARRPPHVQSARDRRLVHDEAREDRLRAVHYSGCWPAHRTGGVSRRVAATMAHGNQILSAGEGTRIVYRQFALVLSLALITTALVVSGAGAAPIGTRKTLLC